MRRTPAPSDDWAHLAGRYLLPYAVAQQIDYVAAWHHALIAQHLEAVEAGRIKRLMIFMPPRHGKSQLASAYFPAWYLGRNPDRQVIACTYAQEFADDWGRKVRNQLADEIHGATFPGCGLREDSTSVKRFHTRANGVYVAVGAGGPITGRGAHLLLIDDPIKNREEAESETVRARLKDWYTSTAYTRLMPGGAVVLIQTRWHVDDLAGWLLDEHKHEDWTVLSLPAIAEHDEPHRRAGEALWPDAYPVEALRHLEATLGPRDFASLYQQRPVPASGAMFPRDGFRLVDAVPAQARRVRYWDKAGTEGGGAYTAGVLMAYAGGRWYVEDVIRGQWSAGQREATIKQTADLDAARYGLTVTTWVEQEPGSGGKESAENTIRNLAGHAVKAERVTGDKATRARPFAAQVEAGNVSVVRAGWSRAFIEEAAVFPAGKYKDQVDAASGAFNKLAAGGGDLLFA